MSTRSSRRNATAAAITNKKNKKNNNKRNKNNQEKKSSVTTTAGRKTYEVKFNLKSFNLTDGEDCFEEDAYLWDKKKYHYVQFFLRTLSLPTIDSTWKLIQAMEVDTKDYKDVKEVSFSEVDDEDEEMDGGEEESYNGHIILDIRDSRVSEYCLYKEGDDEVNVVFRTMGSKYCLVTRARAISVQEGTKKSKEVFVDAMIEDKSLNQQQQSTNDVDHNNTTTEIVSTSSSIISEPEATDVEMENSATTEVIDALSSSCLSSNLGEAALIHTETTIEEVSDVNQSSSDVSIPVTPASATVVATAVPSMVPSPIDVTVNNVTEEQSHKDSTPQQELLLEEIYKALEPETQKITSPISTESLSTQCFVQSPLSVPQLPTPSNDQKPSSSNTQLLDESDDSEFMEDSTSFDSSKLRSSETDRKRKRSQTSDNSLAKDHQPRQHFHPSSPPVFNYSEEDNEEEEEETTIPSSQLATRNIFNSIQSSNKSNRRAQIYEDSSSEDEQLTIKKRSRILQPVFDISVIGDLVKSIGHSYYTMATNIEKGVRANSATLSNENKRLQQELDEKNNIINKMQPGAESIFQKIVNQTFTNFKKKNITIYTRDNIRAMLVVHRCMSRGQVTDPLGLAADQDYLREYFMFFDPKSKEGHHCEKVGCLGIQKIKLNKLLGPTFYQDNINKINELQSSSVQTIDEEIETTKPATSKKQRKRKACDEDEYEEQSIQIDDDDH